MKKTQMKKEQVVKVKETKQSKISKFFSSPIPIIVALVLLVIGLLIYSRYLIKSVTLYNFSGYSEEFSILNGTIYTSRDINYFGDSKIVYTGKDIELHDFEVGYYIKDGDEYNVITKVEPLSSEEETSISLVELLNTMDFSFTEAHKDAMFLSDENINNLDNMIFRISGKDKDEKTVDIQVEIEVQKVSK